MSVFDNPYDPCAQTAARRANEVERWVSQRAYERAARAAADRPAATPRGLRMAPVSWFAHTVVAAMTHGARARHSAPAQPHH